MKTGAKKERAKELAANARGNIKSRRLTKVGGGILAGYLSERPFIDYLSKREQPHYFFFNESKGVSMCGKRVRAGWTSPYRSGMWITDQGVHFTVGKEEEDFHDFIPFHSISSFEVREGMTKNKFVYQTDRGVCRFPSTSGPFESAKRYIQNQLENRSMHQTSPRSSRINVSGGYTLRKLQIMDEYEFEQLVADIWKKQGWTVNLTPGSADRGVDIIAIKNDPFEQRQLIQVKRYSAENKVGSSEIQKYSGLYARNESIDAVIVVTTSEFTSEAKEVARQRNVKTINGWKVVELLEEYEIS